MIAQQTTTVFKVDVLNLACDMIEELQSMFGHQLTIKICLDGVDDCILIYPENQQTQMKLHEHMRHGLPHVPLTHIPLLRL